MTLPDSITVVTEPAEGYLNPKQLVDYRAEREDCLSWLLAVGKDPDRAEGYALGTVKPRANRMDQFYRWVWEREGGYTANVTHEYADEWMQQLARTDYSSAHQTNCQKSVQMLFKWRAAKRGDAVSRANRSERTTTVLLRQSTTDPVLRHKSFTANRGPSALIG